MLAECPICGNEISFSLKYPDGTCRYCRRKFDIKIRQKGKKKHVTLYEKSEENDKKVFTNH